MREAQRRGCEIVDPLTAEPWGYAGSLSMGKVETSTTLSTTRTKSASGPHRLLVGQP
jgi:hypothetical protein